MTTRKKKRQQEGGGFLKKVSSLFNLDTVNFLYFFYYLFCSTLFLIHWSDWWLKDMRNLPISQHKYINAQPGEIWNRNWVRTFFFFGILPKKTELCWFNFRDKLSSKEFGKWQLRHFNLWMNGCLDGCVS